MVDECRYKTYSGVDDAVLLLVLNSLFYLHDKKTHTKVPKHPISCHHRSPTCRTPHLVRKKNEPLWERLFYIVTLTDKCI